MHILYAFFIIIQGPIRAKAQQQRINPFRRRPVALSRDIYLISENRVGLINSHNFSLIHLLIRPGFFPSLHGSGARTDPSFEGRFPVRKKVAGLTGKAFAYVGCVEQRHHTARLPTTRERHTRSS